MFSARHEMMSDMKSVLLTIKELKIWFQLVLGSSPSSTPIEGNDISKILFSVWHPEATGTF